MFNSLETNCNQVQNTPETIKSQETIATEPPSHSSSNDVPPLNILCNISDGIFSLSLDNKTHIPEFAIRALSFGLNFVPDSPSFPIDTIETDFSKFENRLRWKCFWFNKNANNIDPFLDQRFLPLSLRRNISSKPPINTILSTYVNRIKENFQLHIKHSTLPIRNRQLSIDINKTIHFFKSNKSKLLLKPADKGSGTVIIDNLFYINSIEKYITDNSSFFETIDMDPTPTLIEKISSELNIIKRLGLLDHRTYLMLLPSKEKARCPYLYGLPKIHKLPVSFRPIVSGNGHPTENLSIFVDFLLQPYAILSPFYLKDSADLQNHLSTISHLDDKTILFSLDVVSMYPNIPLDELIDSNIRCINKHPSTRLRNKNIFYKPELVKKLLELILYNNYFQFNGKFYYQKHGIAMGTPCACSTSDIFICEWIEEAFELFDLLPTFYKQYRDDGFGIWPHGLDKLVLFVETLNLFHPTLKFTLTHGRELNYLDSNIRINNNGQIHTEIYYKPTDSFAYLHADSNHPQHCMQNIGLSQAIRHIRNCSTFSSYQFHTHFLKHNLIRKGYPPHLISRKIAKIKYNQRPNLLKYKKTKRLTRTPLILTFNNNMPPIKQIVKHVTDDLLDEDTFKAIGTFPIIGYRIQKSTGAQIIRAKS